MAYVKKLFKDNFLYYASYVIKDRAIPDLDDGLKPVQRRILHTLFEADDGKFHKVANIVGSCMKYHPHGDASIYSALVVLANKELFIDRQGNFGNLYTGDEASAARYIECRATSFAKEIFYNPKITEYVDSYDGRNREPTAFPAKMPVVLFTGVDGIAVGMSTKILPHNPVEILEAEIACLEGRDFELFPDFPTSGMVDVGEYADGAGRVRVRAALDAKDPKRILIRELPFGVTTESLIASVEKAAKSGRLKIASISDYTTDKVEIEIKLARGEYAQDTIDALYAFTQCEQSISCNLLVIKDGLPTVMAVAEVVRYHAQKLLSILKRELELELRELMDEIHARTLERIFIEERVYKAIERERTQEAVTKAVLKGLIPFADEIKRELTADDVERLLKIPIRRISLYDIERAKAEMERLKGKVKEAKHHLAHLTEYGIGFLRSVADKLRPAWTRKTKIASFDKVDAKDVARRDVALRYDRQAGYLGTNVSAGELLFDVSPFDRLLVIRRNGLYSVVDVPERLFVDREMAYCALADKDALAEVVFSAVYRPVGGGPGFVKRSKIEQWILNKDYSLIPEDSELLFITAEPKKAFTARYAPKPRTKINVESFKVENFPIKGLKAMGVRLSTREILAVEMKEAKGLFDEADASPEQRGESLAAKAAKAAAGPSAKAMAAPAKAKASPVKPKAGASKAKDAPARSKAGAVKAAASEAVKPRKAAAASAALKAPKAKAEKAKKNASDAEPKKRAGGLLERAAAKKKPPK